MIIDGWTIHKGSAALPALVTGGVWFDANGDAYAYDEGQFE